jgi:Protein of unknown function (DUF2975)
LSSGIAIRAPQSTRNQLAIEKESLPMSPSSQSALPQKATSSIRVSKASEQHRASRALAVCCLLLAVLLPLASVFALANQWPKAMLTVLDDASLPDRDAVLVAAGFTRQLIAALIGLLPVALMSYAMVIAYRCFSGFARGEYFSRSAVITLRAFARAMFVTALACMVVPTLAVLVLTMGGPGQASLVVSVGSQHLVLLLFAGVVWQMARVMAKAVEIAEENAQFV